MSKPTTHSWINFFCLAAIAFWLGGFTFYAAVVVPTGNETFGSIDQGFLTQQVTDQLNVIGVVVLVLLISRFIWVRNSQSRNRTLLISWAVMVLAHVTLYAVHDQLDQMLDPSERVILDDEHFYQTHQVYLWASSAQWLAGLIHAGAIVFGRCPISDDSVRLQTD